MIGASGLPWQYTRPVVHLTKREIIFRVREKAGEEVLSVCGSVPLLFLKPGLSAPTARKLV